MFCSEESEKRKFSKTVKGKTVYALVLNAAFWTGVTTCLKVFAALVKVLHMIDAYWKPSMGFIYGELRKATQEIKVAELDVEANDSIVEILGVLFPGDYELQDHINMVELPMYMNKLENFDQPISIKACAVNNEKFDRRKARNHELLLGEDASEAQAWIVDGDDAHWEAVSDALGSEEEVDEEVECESGDAQIMEQYGQDDH
ncbi:hypothetical protein CTI12_AA495240 [Artemisia annua]|uniref:Uncharacterized protein n=1 Tax=Artemisia annua TaxID=35608 RepID=A0A2U1LG19_ARTAN|nr:hypothetical protein CTI12_AA495240 [Artemisia annua]